MLAPTLPFGGILYYNMCNEEIWKDVQGYEGIYQVSNFGRVKSLPRKVLNWNSNRYLKETILTQSTTKCRDYPIIRLCKDGKIKYISVHRLVATTFIPNPNNLPMINHKDEVKTNNRVDNLEWCDHKYNVNYGTGIQRGAQSRGKAIEMIDSRTQKVVRVFHSAREAFSETGISYKSISSACHKIYKTAGGYIWRFAV